MKFILLKPQQKKSIQGTFKEADDTDLVLSYEDLVGPYFMKIRSITNCPKDEVDDQISPLDLDVRSVITHNHTSRIPIISGNITVRNGMFQRGASKMSLDIARWDTVSGWRDHFLVMALGELCFVYEEIVTDIIRVIAEATQAPTKCPINDGIYRGGNAPAKINPLRHFPTLPYGRYRVYSLYLYPKPPKGPKVRGCMRVIADVTPQNE